MSNELDDFSRLFAGRNDAWGTERGGCIHGRLTRGIWYAHLYGRRPIGVYNVLPAGTCWWSALDLDSNDLGLALRMQEVYRYFGITSWVERSRSKGWHVWVFHAEPIDCALAQDAGLGVLNVLEIPKMEVYPKQREASEKLGNYLRLPYAHIDRDKPNRKILHEGEWLELEDWLPMARQSRVKADAFGTAAACAPEPKRLGACAEIGRRIEAEALGQVIRSSNWGDQDAAQIILGERSISYGERDNQFWSMANLCRGIGMSFDQAAELFEDVYENRCEKGGFSLGQALSKLERTYR